MTGVPEELVEKAVRQFSEHEMRWVDADAEWRCRFCEHAEQFREDDSFADGNTRHRVAAALEAVGLPALLERVEAAERQVVRYQSGIRGAGVALEDMRTRAEVAEAALAKRGIWLAGAKGLARQLADALAERDALAAKVADDSLILATAKASWDRGERDYWDYESDMRPFDPSVTELDGDDCDRGKEWLEIVTEVITDFRAALSGDPE